MSDYEEDNIFAKILRGEAPCVKIYEDADTLAFMDVMPQAEGHVLVIPKAEACDMMDLDGVMAQKLIVNVQKIARAVKSALGCPGVMLAQLNGSAAGQTVFHTHFHIIPRHDGVDLGFHAKEMVAPEALEKIAEKIRPLISETTA
ncbi:MAG: HIT family protein [Candidatus Micropelagos thuwalensis]|nr:HIT family protein [Candidatus Micropelagos thuwalensis]